MRAWVALLLMLGLAGCADGLDVAAVPDDQGSAAPPLVDIEQVARSLPELRTATQGPHRSTLAVLEAVPLTADTAGPRGFAVRLRGDVGLSAVIRSLRIWVFMEPIDGGACAGVAAPVVLRASDPGGMQPALADETRVLVIRSRGTSLPGPGTWNHASFRYGPVPSLNGDFEGWLTFRFPESSDDPSCNVDVRGVVAVEAGERTTAVMPVVRIEARDQVSP